MRIALAPGSSRSARSALPDILSSAQDVEVVLVTRQKSFTVPLSATTGNKSLKVVCGADASQPETLNGAFEGCDAALVVTTHDLKEGIEKDAQSTANLIHAAAEAGVKHIVLVASWTVHEPERLSELASRFLGPESALKNCGAKWTVLRGGYFLQNLLMVVPKIKAGEPIPTTKDTFFAPVDVDNIGHCAAVCLLEGPDKHHQKIYEMTGPEILSQAQMVQIMGQVAGKPVNIQALRAAEAQGPSYMKQLAVYAEESYEKEKKPCSTPFNDDIKTLIGDAKWTRFKDWAEKNKHLWS